MMQLNQPTILIIRQQGLRVAFWQIQCTWATIFQFVFVFHGAKKKLFLLEFSRLIFSTWCSYQVPKPNRLNSGETSDGVVFRSGEDSSELENWKSTTTELIRLKLSAQLLSMKRLWDVKRVIHSRFHRFATGRCTWFFCRCNDKSASNSAWKKSDTKPEGGWHNISDGNTGIQQGFNGCICLSISPIAQRRLAQRRMAHRRKAHRRRRFAHP